MKSSANFLATGYGWPTSPPHPVDLAMDLRRKHPLRAPLVLVEDSDLQQNSFQIYWISK